MIKTWQQRCEEHPDHNGIVTTQMIQERMQEEIDDLRQLCKINKELLKALKNVVRAEDARCWGVFGVDTKGPLKYARTVIAKTEKVYELKLKEKNND